MIGLIIVFLCVLFLPFTVKPIEKNLEIFLFLMGLFAVYIGEGLSSELFWEALQNPIYISGAVLLAGLLFKWFYLPLETGILSFNRKMNPRLFLAFVVIVLGFISSIITAIIASLILVLIVTILRLEREAEVRFIVLACFSIGIGAALTPIGEPLSTLTVSKLNQDFFYLIRLIGIDVTVAILTFGFLTAIVVDPKESKGGYSHHQQIENYSDIFLRTIKIYLFVMGLTLLGEGFEPLIRTYLLGLSPTFLYWANIISAILDNATLAAAEISPEMNEFTIQAILLGLLISGGMLIPGNIPNIIAAGKLKITSKEWAAFGIPIGICAMTIYFIVIFLI
ncbi:putative cation transporter [Oikeobacillus pervagus]|uniref:Cation transporter n=1 Tax=Oikeobacillus pervagus TaxID=1325931 RepID=A0AAJ1WKL5_9BACI|nr:DUF1646 family protein [Oikeobacillus pervagus]MDQ0216733.1 putative cation transporter [Oikeobacillus pervagus]